MPVPSYVNTTAKNKDDWHLITKRKAPPTTLLNCATTSASYTIGVLTKATKATKATIIVHAKAIFGHDLSTCLKKPQLIVAYQQLVA